MLTLKILGFLDDGPLHGYELRRRINELDGPGNQLSDGALYPALSRLERPAPGAHGGDRGSGPQARRIEITARVASACTRCCATRARRR